MITSRSTELREGLFGGVFLFLLEVLPGLADRGCRPRWKIDSECYGNVIPAVLTPVAPGNDQGPSRSITSIREEDHRAVGGDFEAISHLWCDYFRPSDEVVDAADLLDPGLEKAIGIHYRGGDKLKAWWDTNPIGREDFLELILERIEDDPEIDRYLVASDDAEFISIVGRELDFPVSVLPVGASHKSSRKAGALEDRAILAFRDCLLLSRCRSILQTSSALPSFAKVLRPEVDCRRCAASKWFGKVPYFPVAYIPVHEPRAPRLQRVVAKAMVGDWSREPEALRFPEAFAFADRAEILRAVTPRRWWHRYTRR